jgi:hypothetical protein
MKRPGAGRNTGSGRTLSFVEVRRGSLVEEGHTVTRDDDPVVLDSVDAAATAVVDARGFCRFLTT